MILPEILESYRAFVIDLWGVVHDGTQLYPGAADALAYLHAQQKPVVFLSNAPRRAAAAEANLERLGIPRDHYVQVITSGEVAYAIASGQSPVANLRTDHPIIRSSDHRYYYLGPSKDEEIFAGAPSLTRVETMADADFVLNTGYAYDFQPHEEVLPLLQELHAHSLPLLCVNPDLEVVKQDGTHMLCAGTLAAAYESIGGTVHYVGKPHAAVYDTALTTLTTDYSPLTIHHILAIGDNPLTDILGANRYGIDSLLITGGVLAHHHGALSEEKARALCTQEGAAPTYVAPRFAL